LPEILVASAVDFGVVEFTEILGKFAADSEAVEFAEPFEEVELIEISFAFTVAGDFVAAFELLVACLRPLTNWVDERVLRGTKFPESLTNGEIGGVCSRESGGEFTDSETKFEVFGKRKISVFEESLSMGGSPATAIARKKERTMQHIRPTIMFTPIFLNFIPRPNILTAKS
jgi:hypothetical protein